METKTTPKRKKHAEEFKREAVRLLETRGERTVADVAASLGVAENLLHSWKKKYGSAADHHQNQEMPRGRISRFGPNSFCTYSS